MQSPAPEGVRPCWRLAAASLAGAPEGWRERCELRWTTWGGGLSAQTEGDSDEGLRSDKNEGRRSEGASAVLRAGRGALERPGEG